MEKWYFCKNCGEVLKWYDEECPHCGEKITKEEIKERKEEHDKHMQFKLFWAGLE